MLEIGQKKYLSSRYYYQLTLLLPLFSAITPFAKIFAKIFLGTFFEHIEWETGRVEVLFSAQTPPDCLVDNALTFQDVVVQICERGVHSVDPSVRLLPVLVGICQGVE